MNARTTTLLVTGALLVVAVALRVPLLGATDLWLDEAATVIDAALPLREIPGLLPHDGEPPQRYVDSHPPLYYAIVGVFFSIAGASGVAARIVSLLAAVALVLVLARAAPRGVALAGACWAALVVAVHPLALYYGVEAKSYALLWLEVALFLTCLSRAMHANARTRWLVGASALQLSLLYTHNFGVLVAPCWAVALWFARVDGARATLRIFAAGAAALALWLPWAIVVLPWQLGVQAKGAGATFKEDLLASTHTGHIERLVDSARVLSGAPPFPAWLRTLAWVEARPWTWLALLLLPLAIAGVVVAWRSDAHLPNVGRALAARSSRAASASDTPRENGGQAPDPHDEMRSHHDTRATVALLVTCLVSTWIGLWLLDFAAPLFLPGRYETHAIVPLVWLAALAVGRGGRAPVVAGAVVVVALCASSVSFVMQPESHRARTVLAALGERDARVEQVVAAGYSWAFLEVAVRDDMNAGIRPFPEALRTSSGQLANLRVTSAQIEAEAAALAQSWHGPLYLVAAARDRTLADPLAAALLARGCTAEAPTQTKAGLAYVAFACP